MLGCGMCGTLEPPWSLKIYTSYFVTENMLEKGSRNGRGGGRRVWLNNFASLKTFLIGYVKMQLKVVGGFCSH